MKNILGTATRFALYVLAALLDIVTAWLLGKRIIDGVDAAALVGLSALLHLLAASRTLPVPIVPDVHDQP